MPTDPVAIIGAGACGLICALRLKALGIDAVVLERDAAPSGSTALSSGFIPAAGTRVQMALGIVDSVELFAEDIQHKAHGQAPEHLVESYVKGVAEAIDWLESAHGFEFEVLDGFLYPGHRLRRMHSLPQRTGAALMAALLNAAAKEQIAILGRSRVNSLVTCPLIASRLDTAALDTVPSATGSLAAASTELRVHGLTYGRPDGVIETLHASAVMLACNGYGGNMALVRRYIPEMADAVFAGHPGNDGSALMWGESLGAATADLSAYQGHGSWAVPQAALISWALMMDGGIQINAEGERFHDETRGYSEAAVAVLAQPGGVAWNLIDQRGLELARSFPDFVEAEKAGAVKPLDGHSELNATRVAQTIAGFCLSIDRASDSKVNDNNMSDNNTSNNNTNDYDAHDYDAHDDDANRMRSGILAPVQASTRFGRVCTRPLLAPFYAIKVTGALFHTQGGLQIDRQCRVLWKAPEGRATPFIPGLWAGGGAARGVSGQTVEGYLSGNGLLSAIAGGWIAAESIAASLK